MKFWRPRYSIRTLAILVAVIAFSAWWVTWPKRTADRICELLNARQYNEVSTLVATDDERALFEYFEYLERDTPRGVRGSLSTTPRDRSWPDVIRGRQQFILGFHFEVLVERGSISFPGSEGFRRILEQRKAFDRLEQELRQSENPVMSNAKPGP